MTLQSGHFGGEDELRSVLPVIKRLLSETVAGEVKRACRAVAKGKCEHAVDPLQRAPHPLPTDQLEQHFGVGTVAQRHAAAAELRRQRAITVNLSVKDERIARGVVDARLYAARYIDNRQASVPERDAVIDEKAAAVGATVTQRGSHFGQNTVGARGRVCEPGDAAHVLPAARQDWNALGCGMPYNTLYFVRRFAAPLEINAGLHLGHNTQQNE